VRFSPKEVLYQEVKRRKQDVFRLVIVHCVAVLYSLPCMFISLNLEQENGEESFLGLSTCVCQQLAA